MFLKKDCLRLASEAFRHAAIKAEEAQFQTAELYSKAALAWGKVTEFQSKADWYVGHSNKDIKTHYERAASDYQRVACSYNSLAMILSFSRIG